MTETTSACVRGCGLLRQHLTDCDGQDPTGRECRGCLPRRAEHGRLCKPCHRRFELMLTDAPTVYRWLTGNMTAGEGAARAKQDYEQRGGEGDGAPTPVKLAVLDVRDLLADRLAAWADDLTEQRQLTGPGRHTVAADAKFLLTWLTTVESLEWIGDWWEELAETMRDAHALAPWREEVKRIRGVACPECGENNLMVFGGDRNHVTCGSCRLIIPPEMYGLWEQIIEGERMSA